MTSGNRNNVNPYNRGMAKLDYRTSGESHGQALTVLIEGLPAEVPLSATDINDSLARRQGGFGRGPRMKLERDAVNILSGIRSGMSIGSPIALSIANRDWRIDQTPAIHRPRPGHADFAGAVKWLTTDCRSTLERASARETAGRVAAGAVAKGFLKHFQIEVLGFVVQIGEVTARTLDLDDPVKLAAARDSNDVYAPDPTAAMAMIEQIKRARQEKDTVGGIVEVRAFGLPPGLGSCMRWQDKLDGQLMAAVGSVQAIKGVEIGLGFRSASQPGSRVHDEFALDPAQRSMPNMGFVRRSNNAGGLEGGMTNGMPLILRAAMKPISTLLRGLDSINLQTLAAERSDYERSDICAVPAASVVVEHVVAFELARAFLDKFPGDTLRETQAGYDYFLSSARNLANPQPR